MSNEPEPKPIPGEGSPPASTFLTPERLTLLQSAHFRYRPDLPPSARKREAMRERARRERAFDEAHPWWKELDPQMREAVRKMTFTLEQTGFP